jgi:hypothetical protein
MDTLHKEIVNPVAAPLGLFSVKKGEMQSGTAHLHGNDFTINGTVSFNYRYFKDNRNTCEGGVEVDRNVGNFC